MALSDNHKRHLLSSFRHVDGLLSEIETRLCATEAASPFSRYIPDLAPVQRKVTADVIGQLRSQMAGGLKALDVAVADPDVSSLWAIRSSLLNIDIALEEIGPEHMRGYGVVDPEAGEALKGLAANLQKAVSRLSGFLSEDGRGLRERLLSLERAGQDTGVLRQIEQVIARYGLLEFRTPLDLILDRMASNRFEIAIFGRVSSGKSSLLNHVLETDILPVGVTPVTALPTHILYGDTPEAIVAYADRPQERAPIDRLVAFVSEQHNPGNRRHVTGLQVRIPASRIKEGIAFVDTPGIGSLATSGTSEALAYLPRCDLGIVLVDAGSTLGVEDVRMLHLLNEAGTPTRVLLSKSDLLTAHDLESAVGYLRAHLEEEMGEPVPVYAVSTAGPHARRLDAWFEREIAPLCAQHSSLVRASLSRKIGHLRNGVVQTLRNRTAKSRTSAARLPEEEESRLRDALDAGTARIEQARRTCREGIDALPDLEEALIEAAAHALVAAWWKHPRADVGAALRQAVADVLEPQGLRLSGAIRDLHGFLRQTAATLRAHSPFLADAEDLVSETIATGLPAAEANFPSRFAAPCLLPWWLRPFRTFWRGYAVRQVRRVLAGNLAAGLDAYARQLRTWTKGRIDRLEALYDSLAEGCGPILHGRASESLAGERSDPDDLRADLQMLELAVGGPPHRQE